MLIESKWKTTWIPLICWGFGIMTFIMFVTAFVDEREFRQSGIRVEAHVVGTFQRRDYTRRYGGTTHLMYLQYVAMGAMHERSIGNPGGRFRVGDTVTILHAPDNPLRITVQDATDSWVYFWIAPLICIAMGFFIKFGKLRRYPRPY